MKRKKKEKSIKEVKQGWFSSWMNMCGCAEGNNDTSVGSEGFIKQNK